jgi:hypothetical protein
VPLGLGERRLLAREELGPLLRAEPLFLVGPRAGDRRGDVAGRELEEVAVGGVERAARADRR